MHGNIPGNSWAPRSASRNQRRGPTWATEFQCTRRKSSDHSRSHALDGAGFGGPGGSWELDRSTASTTWHRKPDNVVQRVRQIAGLETNIADSITIDPQRSSGTTVPGN